MYIFSDSKLTQLKMLRKTDTKASPNLVDVNSLMFVDPVDVIDTSTLVLGDIRCHSPPVAGHGGGLDSTPDLVSSAVASRAAIAARVQDDQHIADERSSAPDTTPRPVS